MVRTRIVGVPETRFFKPWNSFQNDNFGIARQHSAAMSTLPYGPISWERMIRAVEKVRARLDRAVAALKQAGIPYAVAGGNAVAAWVSRVDEAAVRNTQDVDLLLRRE